MLRSYKINQDLSCKNRCRKMAKIIFTGWNVGIPFVLLLTEKANISLKQAMDIKIKILDDEIIKLTVSSYSAASEIVVRAREFGVICEIIK